MVFFEKLMYLIEERRISKNKLLTDLNLNRNSIQNWQKQGSKPRTETMAQIADYFNVSAESLANDDMELEYRPSIKKSSATKLLSYFQRAACISGGYILSDEKINRFTHFLNANLMYLTNLSYDKYDPDRDYVQNRKEIDINILFDIFEMSDRCSEIEPMRVMMIQISKILLYRIEHYPGPKHCEGDTNLYNCNILLKEKLDFLYSNEPSKNPAMNFGFNFTEITAIHNATKMSYLYLFTGEMD